MEMRSFCMLLAVALLSACASTTADQSATKPQDAIYVVGDGEVPLHLRPADTQSAEPAQDPAKPIRLNWFFSGR